jgi:hypothetical protein
VVNLVDPPLPGYDPDAVLAAEDLVRTHCGWHIAPAVTEVLTLNGKGSAYLRLPSKRVTAITLIVNDGVTLPASNYTWAIDGLVTLLSGYWTTKSRAIQVSLTHGYTSCPAAVRREIERLAAAGGGGSLQTPTLERIGDVAVNYGSSPSPDFNALRAYQLSGVA